MRQNTEDSEAVFLKQTTGQVQPPWLAVSQKTCCLALPFVCTATLRLSHMSSLSDLQLKASVVSISRGPGTFLSAV